MYWTPLHLHTDYSNPNYFETVSKVDDYIKRAQELGQTSVAITEHGNVAGWISKKVNINNSGLKFIGGIEAYLTFNLEDNDRFHTIILAKNYDGIKDINQLSSASYNREDRHFYYKPRITFDELEQAIKRGNIYVTTACLGGAYWQLYKNNRVEELTKWQQFCKVYSQDVFLEVQPHLDKEQKEYNQLLVNFAKENGLQLIASNDIHALNKQHDKLRKIIQKGKKQAYEEDGNIDLTYKSYEEMVDSFKEQGVLSEDEIIKALQLTNDIADSVDDFELDRSNKYPHLYSDEEQEFKNRINQGYIERGINKLDKATQRKYKERILYEFSVYQKMNSISYMLLHNDIIKSAHEHGIHNGYSRGSVSGSLIAYLIGDTEVDSIEHNLVFERFMNPERVNLPDIDTDFAGEDRTWVQQWLLTNDKFSSASILTVGTLGFKGAIKAIADGLPKYQGQASYIQSIRNEVDDDGNYSEPLYKEHKELFDLAKQVVGIIDNFGRHAAGIVIDESSLNQVMGTMTLKDWDYPVSSVTMHDIDYCNWIKFDILGLDNMALITKTVKLANLPFLTPQSTDIVDFQDEKVWKSIAQDNIGIFQFESERAGKLLKDMFSDETLNRIRKKNPNFKYIDLLSLATASQRPSGASYVDEVTHGIFKDNGHPALNDFLSDTLGYLVYQEQQTKFLVEFAGYSVGKADIIRKGIGKKRKDIMEKEVPKIKPAFIDTMVKKYGDTQEHAEQVADSFIQVFMDSVNYGFSINHALPYSYIGYVIGWLRYYYPLEWATSAMRTWWDKQDKLNRVLDYVQQHQIDIKPATFRKSKGLVYMDKNTNSIYEGTASIKGNNEMVGDSLFELKDKKFESFSHLLLYLHDGTKLKFKDSGQIIDMYNLYMYNHFDLEDNGFSSIADIDKSLSNKDGRVERNSDNKVYSINKTKMLSLIRLDFFREFGKSKTLEDVYTLFKKKYKPTNKKFANKQKAFHLIVDYEQKHNEDYSLADKLGFQLRYLKRCTLINDASPKNIFFVTDLNKFTTRIRVKLYSIKTGKTWDMLIGTKLFGANQFDIGNFIIGEQVLAKPKIVNKDGEWVKSEVDKDYWLKAYKII